MRKTLNNFKLLDEGICPDCDENMDANSYYFECQSCGKTYDYDWIEENLAELDDEGGEEDEMY